MGIVYVIIVSITLVSNTVSLASRKEPAEHAERYCMHIPPPYPIRSKTPLIAWCSSRNEPPTRAPTS